MANRATQRETTGASEILIVDDDAALGAALETYLAEAGYSVTRRENVAAARAALAETRPDLCIVDIVMPGASGKVLCREIAEAGRAAVIMMSSLSDQETVIALLGLGADDYIVKPFHFAEMRARIQAVLRRRIGPASPPAAQTRIGAWEFDPAARRLRDAAGRSIALTGAEIEFLRFLTASPGITFSREDLLAVTRARQHAGGDDRSVDNLVKRLRRKIEPDPANPVHIVTVWGAGYKFVPN